MCQTVFSLGYYGIKKTTKTYKSQGMQLSPMKTADVTLKTQNEIGGCLTQQINALLFVMACQSIVSTEIMKIKIFYLENIGAERFKRDLDWCYA